MKKIIVILLMLFAFSYGRSQTSEMTGQYESVDCSSFLNDFPSEVEVLQDSVLIQELTLAIQDGSINNNAFSKDSNKYAAGILNILLGDIGVGHFYTGQTVRGILDILFCWTGVPGLIGLIEGVIWLCEDDDAWAERVAKWNE